MVKERKPRVAEQEFSLDEVLKLGGTKEDYEFLKDVNDVETTAPTKDTLKDDEFKEFFRSVGFDKITEGLRDAREEEYFEEEDEKGTSESKEAKEKSKGKKPKFDKFAEDKNKREKKDKVVDVTFKKGKEKSKVGREEANFCLKSNLAPLQDDRISSTTDETVSTTELSSKVFNHILELAKIMPRKLLCKTEGPWYENDISKMSASKKPLSPNDPTIIQLKTLGSKLLENETIMYKTKKKSTSGNDPWLRTVVTAGTLSDRVAAYTLMLQKAPLHSSWCLDAFLSMLKRKGKREALIGLESLRDIFLAELLPDGRRLRSFHQQPLAVLKTIFQAEKGGAAGKRLEIQRHLTRWTLEERIKTAYRQLVISLRDFFLQDSIEAFKTKGMKVALDLLQSKPELERELLTMLVNKLGDPKHKIASKALHMLHCLIQEHPLMQGVVVGAVRDLLLRPNIQAKCQYYCICFLSAQILSHDRKDVADLLIQIYLGFFKSVVKQKQIDNKLLSAILTGVNRAYPYANTEDEKIMEELNVLYKTVHVSSFGTAVQALMLLFQILSSRDELSDRYYNALYSSLLHPELPLCSNRHPMYLNLIYRSLKADSSPSRVRAFLKRLLQTCSLQLPPYTSAVLVLITELLRTDPSLKLCFKNDERDSRLKSSQGLSAAGIMDVEDEEEHFVDVDKEEETAHTDIQGVAKNAESSWTHVRGKTLHCRSSNYDPTHRNPAYANAGNSSLWEMQQIRRHFHPTVVKFAAEIADVNNSGVPDQYPGDPLQDFSLMKFLDKFVYRNPKAKQNKDANVGDAVFRRKRMSTMAGTNTIAANAPEFLQKKYFNPEEVFLQKYFASRAAGGAKTQPSKEKGGDVEEVSDDEFDRFLESTEGKAELESQFDFAKGTAGPKAKKRKKDSQDDDDGEEDELSDKDDDLESDGNEEFRDEDPFSEEGMTFNSLEEDARPQPKKEKGQKSVKRDVDTFDMMLEENSRNRSNTSGSGAVRNTDRASARQLRWENRKETREIVARKRARKRSGAFSKGGKRQRFDGKRNAKFGAKKNFQKRR